MHFLELRHYNINLEERKQRGVLSCGREPVMEEKQQAEVCLVQMPYAETGLPSLALSLFAAELRAAGISTFVDYANIHFASGIGFDSYDRLTFSRYTLMLMEFVFRPAAYGKPADIAAYVEDGLERFQLPELTDSSSSGAGRQQKRAELEARIREWQEAAEVFIKETAARLLSLQPRIVAFSSMFQQNNAIAALARELKRLRPELVILMGGANCADEAGAARLEYFPEIDYAFLGEADEIFLPFCKELLAGRRPTGEALPYGVIDRAAGRVSGIHRLTQDIESLPYPDYSDYYRTVQRFFPKSRAHRLMVEGSRGCWWGEKHACTFCGLNGKSMRYRSKTPQRLAAELKFLAETYPLSDKIMFADSILSNEQARELPELLAALPRPLRYFSEIKSNVSLKELRALKRAGFEGFQPGIESLSDHVLTLMNKGCRAIKQIETLKNYRRLNLGITWNMLCGFPGETDEDHERAAELIPALYHLPPPNGFFHLSYHRSSHYEQNRERYGLVLEPASVYRHIYPFGEDFLARMAYLFDPADKKARDEVYDCTRLGPGYKRVAEEIYSWARAWQGKPDRLDMRDKGGSIEIFDLRHGAEQLFYELTGIMAAVYRLADTVISLERLAGLLPEAERPAIEAAVQQLVAAKLMVRLGGEVLALAIAEEN